MRCLAFLVLTPSLALAQPVTHPGDVGCRVDVVLAPDSVRRAIESWVAAEPRCAEQLEVRVVPTEGGYYLSARDGSNRVRERIVPDAQSAAVLVVSWMADDSLDPTLPEPTPPVALRAPMPAFDLPEPVVELAVRHRRLERSAREHWLSLGALASGNGLGARGQLDMLRGEHWMVGAGGGIEGGGDRNRMHEHATSRGAGSSRRWSPIPRSSSPTRARPTSRVCAPRSPR